jgi:excisionase family DNA binding protein
MSSFMPISARLLAYKGIQRRPALENDAISSLFSTKGPQSFAALTFRAHLPKDAGQPTANEGEPMPITPLQPRSDRQLVFTSSQAARYIGVSLATIRRWTDAGHIHCYRTPGGQRRFSRDQLDEFVTSMQNAGEIQDPPAVKVA